MLIPIQVTFRNMEQDNELEECVRSEAAKLEKYYARVSSCRVVVERVATPDAQNPYHVRIDLGVPKGELVVTHEATPYAGLKDIHQRKTAKKTELRHAWRNARRSIHEAFQEMRRRLQDHARKLRGDVKTLDAGLAHATVVKLFPEAGYGILDTGDGREVYFHRDSVLNHHFDRLRTGLEVGFVEEAGEKGAQASTVRVLHPRRLARASSAACPWPAGPRVSVTP